MGAFFSKPVVVLDYKPDFSSDGVECLLLEKTRIKEQIEQLKDLCTKSIVDYFVHLFPFPFTSDVEEIICSIFYNLEHLFNSLEVIGLILYHYGRMWRHHTQGTTVPDWLISSLDDLASSSQENLCVHIKIAELQEERMKMILLQQNLRDTDTEHGEICDVMTMLSKLLRTLQPDFKYVRQAHEIYSKRGDIISQNQLLDEDTTKRCNSKCVDLQELVMIWMKRLAVNVGKFRMEMLEFISDNKSHTWYLRF